MVRQLCQQHRQALKRVPRFIRTLGWKLELFKSYCPENIELESRVREVCFDIQVSVLDALSTQLLLVHKILASGGKSWKTLPE